MNHEEKFKNLLMFIARRTKEEIESQDLIFYRMKLRDYDIEKINQVLSDIAEDPKRFPSVRDITSKLGDTRAISTKDNASVAVGAIFNCIRKYGWPNGEKAKEEMGDLAWQIVTMQGGWNNVCNILTNQNQGFYQTQWVNLGIGILERSKANAGNAPALGESKMKENPALKHVMQNQISE